ncbi:hypothetical protein IFR05_008648 [Cadophora sp. M221]|nr:hypothetical protein IFR05_008648 [Cadophora sp. M221]
MANAVHSPITASGTITTFLPLSTGWSSPPQSSSLFVIPMNETLLQVYAFDPGYGLNNGGIAKSYHPPEVTAWWKQEAGQGLTTRTELGGEYTFISWANAPYPSQCTSTMLAQMLTYVQPVLGLGPDWTTATKALTAQTGILAVQVNGFLFHTPAATLSSSGSSSASRAASTTQPVSATSTSIATASKTNLTTPSQSHEGLSRGDQISLGVGLGIGVPTIILMIIGIKIALETLSAGRPKPEVINGREGWRNKSMKILRSFREAIVPRRRKRHDIALHNVTEAQPTAPSHEPDTG